MEEDIFFATLPVICYVQNAVEFFTSVCIIIVDCHYSGEKMQNRQSQAFRKQKQSKPCVPNPEFTEIKQTTSMIALKFSHG